MRRRLSLVGSLAAVVLLARVAAGVAPQHSAATVTVDPAFFQDLRFRSVGPHRGGRVTAVAGVRSQPCTFYMGATGGGVWKTTSCGQLWTPVSDGQIAVGSIGAIDVSDSNPDIVFVGTGSAAIRSNVSIGRGVYKSTDGGRTWTFAGLRDAGQIGAVRIHPKNPEIVYVAALGNPFAPNRERGVFRTRDGGRTWQHVLFINERTGAVSLAMNPSNPDEIYAGAWRGERKPWTIISGGPASEGGIYKTTDGGDSWTHLTAGLPGRLIGKVDVDVARSDPRVVYVLAEAPGDERGLYRSDDGGATFRQVNNDFDLLRRPFYYTYVDVDPKNPNIVYVNNEDFWRSEDGGKTFRAIRTPHGDNHGMWINPDNPQIFIQSNDGGANVTLDGGRTWSTQLNQPTAELYMVSVDEQVPYRLYAPQQDNSTIVVPSLLPIAWRPDHPAQVWMQGPGCETGQIHPRPDGRVIYGVCKGEFGRYDVTTGQEQLYWVWPQNRYGHNPRDMKFRFVRQSPFEVSPHDPKVIYHGSQYVHRTTDEGVTWEIISPDLTANEPDKQVISGEPITRDITGEEVYSALYAIEESRLERGVIWAGSNDGPVHVTRDGGRTWTNVTPKDLPPGGRVQTIEDSPHRKGSAYIAVYRYLLGDFRPYIYRTDDYGKTWTRLTDGTNGIPADTPTRVVREDPDREGLLYAGTEFGLYISFDNGRRWQPFQLNLPATPVTDIRVHRQDLVLSTMGRGFWILDNITPLHQLPPAGAATPTAGNGGRSSDGAHGQSAAANARALLFRPRPAYRLQVATSGGRPDLPEYPAAGAQIDYYFAETPRGPVTLEILDAAGRTVRRLTSEAVTAAAEAGRGPALGMGAGA
ncbi:MAG TPA: hypothetical protein VNI83_10340, partial [Vicinamibacterales bacterium]|nr:hypothetical protein [Vicinamibacterales bacterium]